jgi:hypothetical protein
MADLEEIALALPETERSASDDGRPAYATNGRTCVSHRAPRKDTLDPETRERTERDELYDLVVEAWPSRAQKRVAKAWLAEHDPAS